MLKKRKRKKKTREIYKGKTHPTYEDAVWRSKTSPPPSSSDLSQVSISTPSLPWTFSSSSARCGTSSRFLILHPLPRRRTHLPATSLPPPPHNLQPWERRRITRRMHRLTTRRCRGPRAMAMRSRMARWCFVLASDNTLPSSTHGFANATLSCFG